MGKQNHFTQTERDEIIKDISNYAEKYLGVVKPPIDETQINAWPELIETMLPHSWAKTISFLSQHIDFPSSNYICFRTENYRFTIVNNINSAAFIKLKSTLVMQPDHSEYGAWELFGKEFIAYKQEAHRAYHFAWGTINSCNTPGQLIRIWPEIIDFLPQRSKQIISNMDRAARPPKNISPLSSEFFHNRDFANEMIPKMMLAPKPQYNEYKVSVENQPPGNADTTPTYIV